MRRIGRYALLSRAASGDHSELFLACVFDRGSGTGEPMAGEVVLLELLRGALASDMELGRLWLAEGPAAMRFRHANAVRIFDVDRTPTELFAAQELVKGQSLTTVLQRTSGGGPGLAPEVFIYVVGEVASALAHAHAGSEPLVHGGLSPRAIMLGYDGSVRLLGLGSGRARLRLPIPRSRLQYIGPEVLLDQGAVPRSDIFGLGVCLHEALTGERLFRRASEAETRAAILEGDVDVCQVLEPHGDRLVTLVERMIARSLDRRPATAEVDAQIRGILTGRQGALREALAHFMAEAFHDEQAAQERQIEAALRQMPQAVTRAATEPAPSPPPRPVTGEGSVDGIPIDVSVEDSEFDVSDDQIPTPLPVPGEIPVPKRVSKPSGLPERTTDAPSGRGPEAEAAHLADLDANVSTVPSGRPPLSGADIGRWLARAESSENAGAEEVEENRSSGELDFAVDEESDEDLATAVGPPRGTEHTASPSVARYRKEGLIASSSLASVYLAVDAILGRKVLLKLSEVADERSAPIELGRRVKVLRREARIAATLDHPRLPRLFDAGRDADHYFVVYQLVEGESLDRRLARVGRDSPRAVVRWLRDVADGLNHLHQRGLLHGDLSLANVMIEPDGHARLVDLSMVRATTADDHPIPYGPSASTAPEVLGGRAYDYRAEQFALGWIAYRALTGGTPWPGSGPALRQAMDRLELESPRALVPEIEPGLNSVLVRMLEREPSQRFASLREVVAAIDLFGGTPVEAVSAVVHRHSEPEIGTLSASALASGLEVLLARLETLPEAAPGREEALLLARATARRLGLGESDCVAAALFTAARSLLARSGGDGSRLAGVLPGPFIERLTAATNDDAERSGRPRVAAERSLAVAEVVDAYLGATRLGQNGKRTSPRRAVLALREQADAHQFDPRVVEALIDHLREVISALDVPRRPLTSRRLLLAGVSANPALQKTLANRGFDLEVAGSAEDAWRMLSSEFFDAAIVDRSLRQDSGFGLVRRIRDDNRTRSLPLVVLEGGAGEASDELSGGAPPVELVSRSAAPEQILGALERRLSATSPSAKL